MKILRIAAVLIVFISFSACTNIQGNQESDNLELDHPASDKDNDQPKPIYLTYDTFIEKVWDFESNPQEWVYKGEVPCVVDFYADWCKPCKMVAPIMDDLAKEYDGKVQIYKVDVDKEKKLAAVFQVKSIPSVLFSPKEGRPMMQAGALQKEQYVNIIEKELLKNK